FASKAGRRSILAIGGNAVAARAEIVVPSGLIGLAGIHRIPVALLVEVVLVSDRVHVGRVVDGPGVGGYPGVPEAGLPRGFCRVRPSDVEVVLAGDLLSQREPRAVALPLVEVRIGSFAGHPLDDHVEYGIGGDYVLDAHLHRRFIGDADLADGGDVLIAGTIGLLVQLVRRSRVDGTRLVDARHAVGIAEGAVIAGARKTKLCYSSSSPCAIGLAARIVAVVARPVLSGSPERAERGTAKFRGFVPH